MTDKELAKEYRKSLKQRLIDEDDFERLEMFDENVEEAFLAGLKAGRPQWHDLKKDPNDLPKVKEGKTFEGKPYYDSNIVQNQIGQHCWYNHKNNKWWDMTHRLEEVIAWCEIPKFEG